MSRPEKKRRLTDTQSDLVAANIGLAWHAAFARQKRIYSLSKNEILSAACLGLCKAGMSYNPSCGRPFQPYANTAIHHQIDNETRRKIQKEQRVPIGKLEFDVAKKESGREAERDEATVEVNEWILTLGEEDRRMVREHMGGVSFAAIGRRLGLCRERIAQRYRVLMASAGGKR